MSLDSEAFELEPPMETLAGLIVSPETDIPFGKPFQMGLAQYTIYERAIEQGYQAGIRAHLDFMKDHADSPPVMLDDAQFTLLLDAFQPKEMATRDRALWRAHCIAGWVSVFLGLVPEIWERYAS
jgi:hypothetical protein